MGSQLPSTCYTMCCAKGKLWSFVVLFSVMVWSTCYGEVLDCNELFFSLDDIEEGIVLAGCKTDPDSVVCVELWGEKTVLNELIYELGCRVGKSFSSSASALSTWNDVRDEFCYADPEIPAAFAATEYDAFVAARDWATLTPIATTVVPWLKEHVKKVVEKLWKAHDTYNWFVSAFGRHEESAMIIGGSKSNKKEWDNLCNEFGMNIWFKSDRYVKKDECTRSDRSKVLDIMETARDVPGYTSREIAEEIQRRMKNAGIKYHFISVVQTLGESGRWMRGDEGPNSCYLSLPPILNDVIPAVAPTGFRPDTLATLKFPQPHYRGLMCLFGSMLLMYCVK